MAHPDLNMLKDALLPVAKQMLAEEGEFFPYGAFMKLNGTIVDCGVDDNSERPPSQRLIDLLVKSIRERAVKGEIRAAGICADVRASKPGESKKVDAIHFALEHQNGEALDVFLPYDLDASPQVIYGELFATPRTAQFFVAV